MMNLLDSLSIRQVRARSRQTRCNGRRLGRKAVFEFQPGWELISLENRTLLSSVTFINATGGDWDTPSNWSTGLVPGAADDVTIDVPGVTINHSQNNADSVRTLTTGDNLLAIENGSLSIGSTSTIAGTLNLRGGTLEGAGTVTVAGALNWDVGTMAGTGQTIATGTVNIDNGILDTRSFTNDGTATLSGVLSFDNGASFTNADTGSFNAQISASLDRGDSSSPTFSNAGAFNAQANAGSTVTDNGVAFTSGGTVAVSSGTLALLDPGGTDNGSFTVASNATLAFGETATTLSAQSSVSGGGTVVFDNDGMTTIDGGYNVGSLDTVVYATAHQPGASFPPFPTSPTYLFGTIDLTTGRFTDITATNELINSLTAGPGGTVVAGGNDGVLYSINPSGATSEIAAVTVPSNPTTASLAGLATETDGAAGFFADNITPASGPSLYQATLDHISADGSSVSVIGNMDEELGNASTGNLAVGPDGKLYLDFVNGSGIPSLSLVNTTTGEATAIGSGLNVVNPLTLVSSGTTLYGIDTYAPTNPAIYTVDTTTGAATMVGTVSGLGSGFYLDSMAQPSASIAPGSTTSVETNAVVNFDGTLTSLGSELNMGSGTANLGSKSVNVASLDLNGGTLTGTGTLTVTGALTWNGSGLKAAGNVDLAGATLHLAGNLKSVAGDVFTIVSAASVTGTFNDLAQNASISFNGRSLTVSYNPTTVTLTDTPATITPTIAWPTPGPIVYGTALSGTQLDATAFYNGTPVPGTFTYGPLGTTLNAGLNQSLTVRFDPIDSTEYNSTTASTEINVIAALFTVVVSRASRSYGQANPTFTVSYVGFVPGQGPGELSGALAFGTAAVPSSNVGGYAVQATGLASQNYTISYEPGVLSVDPAFLTFTAINRSKKFKAPRPSLTYTESGLVLGQSAKKVFKGAPVLSTTATKNSPIGQYAIVVKRGTLQLIRKNYTFTLVDGILQVVGKAQG